MKEEENENIEFNILQPNDEYYRSIRQVPENTFEGLHLSSPEEIEAFLATEIEEEDTKPAPEIDHSDEAKALEAFFMSKDESIKLANEILSKNPDCIEAKLAVIGWNKDPEERINDLEDMLEEYEEKFDHSEAFKASDQGRAFLRIKASLGEEYLKEDYYEDGMEIIQEVFEEDKRDDFGVGFVIAVELAKRGLWPALNKFWNRFDAQVNIVTSVLRAVTYFNIYGNKVKSKKALNEAYELDSTPFDVISGAMSMEGISEEESEDEEVLFALHILYDLMARNEKLTRWIVTHITRKEED